MSTTETTVPQDIQAAAETLARIWRKVDEEDYRAGYITGAMAERDRVSMTIRDVARRLSSHDVDENVRLSLAADLLKPVSETTEMAEREKHRWRDVNVEPPELYQDCIFIVETWNKDYDGKMFGGKYQGFKRRYHGFATPGIEFSARLWQPMPEPPPEITVGNALAQPEEISNSFNDKKIMKIVELKPCYFEYLRTFMSIRWDCTTTEINEFISRWFSRKGNSICYIGLMDEKPMAYGVFDTEHEKFKDLTPWCISVWVDPDFRGNEFGAALQQKRFEYAKNLGYSEIYLDTLLAKEYHLKHGWVLVDRRDWGPYGVFDIMKYSLSDIPNNCPNENHGGC